MGFIEMAVGAIDDVRLGQGGATFGVKLTDHEVVDLRGVGAGSGLGRFWRGGRLGSRDLCEGQ